jgi:hypothetical protein
MKAILIRIEKLLIAMLEEWQVEREPSRIPVEAEVWMDSYEVKQLLNIADATLFRRRCEGVFVAKKIGKKWFYLKSSLQ